MKELYPQIAVPFSAEGFCKIDVMQTLVGAGYSKTEARRLYKEGAVKVWDGEVRENKIYWYLRKAEPFELVDRESVIRVGKHVAIKLRGKPINIFKSFWWWIRPYWEHYILDRIT